MTVSAQASSDVTSSKEKFQKYKKIKVQCPISSCQRVVAELPRHLRRVHGWSPKKAKYARASYKLRRSIIQKQSEKDRKDTHHYKHCPFDDCRAIVKRMPAHLQNVHKVSREEDRYKVLLRKAKLAKRYANVSRSGQSGQELQDESNPVMEEAFLEGEEKEGNSDSSDYEEEQLANYSSDDTEEENIVIDSEEVSSLEIDARNTSHNHHSHYMVQVFLNYLLSADCGNKNEEAAKQCAKQVERILSVVDDDGDVNSLLDKHLIRDLFLRQYADKERRFDPRTVKSYLKSLDHFCNFLLSEKFNNIDRDRVIEMQANLTRWNSAYTGRVKEASFAKMEIQRMCRIYPEDINTFERSQVVEDTAEMFTQLETGVQFIISREAFTNGRDLVAIEIFINNGHRPAPIRNMTMQNFRMATYREDDEQFAITVMTHKGTKDHGPAEVILTTKLYRWLGLYIKHLRSVVTKDTHDGAMVFLTWNSQPFPKGGSLSNALNAIWQKGGIQKRICATKLRKAAVSVARESMDPTSSFHEDLATLMCHKKSTADKYYYSEDRIKKARKAAKQLPVLMRTVVSGEASGSKEPDTHLGRASVPARKVWTVEETNEINRLFPQEVVTGDVSFEEVKEKIKTSNLLSQHTPRKVYDKVRSLYRFASGLSSGHQVTANDCTPSMSGEEVADTLSKESGATLRNSKPKDIFSVEDADVIKRCCKNLIRGESVSKLKISSCLAVSEHGRRVLDRFTIKQIQNRIKYERRLARESSSYGNTFF